ncbi:MAG: hypothetical protein L0211_15530 [Planctomycetaceae bacterium]|nr:hypothetical protein [Planctomycetaceae bacterium]
MTKPTIYLDLVQVASPCHVAWEDMAGDERRRFCKHCNLPVYNLSDMPRAEAEAFVNQAEGRTCIRFYRREDGTVLTRDCPVGLRAVRQRLVRAVAALAGLMLALLTGTVFAGWVKNLTLPGVGRPADAFSEWIEPGSTQPVLMGAMMALPLQGEIVVEEHELAPQESPLPEPTPQQLEEIAERLAK